MNENSSLTGLSETEQSLLRTVFVNHPEIEYVLLFGSRAKGTSRKNSDIDLAVSGINDDLKIEELAMELEELPLPYKFDVKAIENIKNIKLSEHIRRAGIKIYNNASKQSNNF